MNNNTKTGMNDAVHAVASQTSLPSLHTPAPSAIRIVGLGPGAFGDLSLAAWQALSTAPRVLARTGRHPTLDELAAYTTIATCDDLYEQHETFSGVYAAIVERVIHLAQEPEGVVYAEPGQPWVGEATTR